MGLSYRQLTREDRRELAPLQAQGCSLYPRATELARAPASIARAGQRNGSSRQCGCLVAYAHQQAQARRWHGSKPERDAELREQVLARRKAGWSPEPGYGRLARETGRTIVSGAALYCFIDAQIRRGKEYDCRHCRPRGQAQIIRRSRKGAASRIPQRQGLEPRPPTGDTRQTFGYWAAARMLFSAYGQAALSRHERRSPRLLGWRRPAGKAAEPSPGSSGKPWAVCRQRRGRALPLTMASSSRGIIAGTTGGLPPTSAIPTPPGKRAGGKTPLAGGAPAHQFAGFAGRLAEQWMRAYNNTPRKGLTYRPRPRRSSQKCCAGKGNSPSRARGKDGR